MKYNYEISKWVLERNDILDAYGDALDPESVFKTEVAAAIVLFDTSEDTFNWMYNNMITTNIEKAEYAMATDATLLPIIKRALLAQYKRNALGFVMNIKDSGELADLEVDFWVNNVSQLLQIMKNLRVKFPNTIKNYTYFYESEFYKLKYIPEE